MAPRGSTKTAPRGPAALRHDRQRKDKDGDMAMGTAIKGRAGISKKAPAGAKANGRDLTSRVGAKKGILGTNAQREILKRAGAPDVTMREAKIPQHRGPVELKIGSWSKNKASANPDGGVSSLISWLEKKASHKLGSRARSVKIKKSRVDGDDLIITVPAEDIGALLRLNGWVWAGANITVQRVGGGAQEPSSETIRIKDMIKGVLERRYNMEDKLLDLSSLGSDPELQAQAVFNQKSTTSKFFPAMMKVLEEAFDTPKDKDEAIISVSLANNDLADLNFVTTLSHTLPKIRNLDLSNNQFASVDKLSLWKKRFPQLSHLVVSGNPFQQPEQEVVTTLTNWFTRLRMLNSVQVRTEEEVAKRAHITDLPFPIRTATFQDEGGIVEGFVRNFFAGFDTDRTAVANMYYDAQSTFSLSVNTSAPRDPSHDTSSEKQEWDEYIKISRNLKKLSQLPARKHRLLRGNSAIAESFAGIPKSKHPDLATEAKRWMIEAHMQPGVPDAAGQSPNGVDGFMVVVHGEFDELDATTGQPKRKRSFDRTFILGPGGPSGVRVVNDMLTVRAYGGTQAFEPDVDNHNQVAAAADQLVPQLPPGLTLEVAEQMVMELSKQTRLNIHTAKQCLEQVNWDFNVALQAFESVKATLPPDCFLPAAQA